MAPSSAVGNPRNAARAIVALRRGWIVRIESAGTAIQIAAIETTNAIAGVTGLLLSASRAATLKLVNQRAAADTNLPVCIAVPADMDMSMALAIADPTLDLRYPMKGPFAAQPIGEAAPLIAAMELARLAGLLPAFLVLGEEAVAEEIVTPEDVLAFDDSNALEIATRARLPVAANAEAEIVAFRSVADSTDHVALVIGKRDQSDPVVRLHSECLTGDVLGSLKCDCGPQLHEALHQISDAQWGILLYLRQEGRGIGLINKLRAYALQDQGFDTVDANVRLGFAIDARDFSVAAHMLKLLGVSSVRLLTNNPEKVAGLQAEGIAVPERLPLKIASNPHNAHYLATKRDRTGHKL
ncbi:MAG: GTP cyclohydrolase II [Sphingopyxis sp.]|nr:GTP cyclohydrolase II [Sphingopyxis sp.]